MKITKRKLRKIIRESLLQEQQRPSADTGYVLQALGGKDRGSRTVKAAEKGDFILAANLVMDALWVDDPWPEDEEALEDMIKDSADPSTGMYSVDSIAAAGAKWLTKFRQGGWRDHSKPFPKDGLKSLYTRPRPKKSPDTGMA